MKKIIHLLFVILIGITKQSMAATPVFIKNTNAHFIKNSSEKGFRSKQTSWYHYKPTVGTIGFSYPAGWVIGNAEVKDCYTENYYIQPPNQDFRGSYGQKVVRVFDPVYVGEQASVSFGSPSLTVFRNFIATLPGTDASSVKTVYYDGKQYYQAQDFSSGFEARYLGYVNPNGTLYVVGMVAGPRLDENGEYILYTIAQSVTGVEFARNLTDQEATVRRWYGLLATGNYDDLMSLSCESARQANLITILGSQLLGAPDMRSYIMRAAKGYNFSNLWYYTACSKQGLAVVRICGFVTNPYGRLVPFYKYAALTGGSNLLVVTMEGSTWKVCQFMKPRSF